MYAKTRQGQAGGAEQGPSAADGGRQGAEDGGKEEVVDADFKEVK
jgi:hypothetical protein